MPEIEGKGVDYERYALNKLFSRFVRDYSIRRVLEVPAKGEKAMPSFYSVAFGQAGCDVTLVNPERKSDWAWKELGYPVEYRDCDDLHHTGLESGGHDLVWNFMHLAHDPSPEMLDEMKRLSSRYLLFVSVNRFNPGFFSHRTVHRINKVPWTHGDVGHMNPFAVSRRFGEAGMRIVERGLVDTPPYPDSLGFRDMRLHRMNVDLNKIDWDSRTVRWMKEGDYPPKIKFLYLFERLPLPFVLKMLYAHLFYVLAEIPGGSGK